MIERAAEVRKILLDSNALFYYVTGSNRFGRRSIALLDSSELFFSPISLVELKLKVLGGKLRLSSLDPQDFERIGLRPTSFSMEAASAFELWANQDPFDNMLLAQAKESGASFMTSDFKILSSGLEFVLDLTD